MTQLTIRLIQESDQTFVKQALTNLWGSEQIVYSGKVFDGATLPGLLAEENGRIVGLLTYAINNTSCQIISLNALTPGKGIGTALLAEVEKVACEEGCSKLTVITTNDNLKALGFYQKRGFVLKAVYPNAIEKSRKVKPEISLIGEDGIPLRDEIELEKTL